MREPNDLMVIRQYAPDTNRCLQALLALLRSSRQGDAAKEKTQRVITAESFTMEKKCTTKL